MYRPPLAPRLFGGKDHQMRLQALPRTGEDQAGVVAGHGRHERVHQTIVSACVCAHALALRNHVYDLCRVAEEVVQPDGAAFAEQLAVRAEDRGAAFALLGKGHHAEGGRPAALELHLHHLVVQHVVVAAIDAAAIRPLAQRSLHALGRHIGRQYVHWPAGFASGHPPQIDLAGRVGAVCFDLAIRAAIGCAGRLVLPPKMA